ncbi:protein-ADP-ribose hydrolase [Collinsella sp. An2]|uniref:protein-ADP-ribose hydrolase n=1 Tax=Collinsella sp. An2 TaxID=1965585 RepID=UPI000B37B4B9|nr:protein-ADP-ribose hydrolase [Collinsella sp. An2]OUP11141.1 hypothetical protein B5F33_01880 [Collinsella sp. An2]
MDEKRKNELVSRTVAWLVDERRRTGGWMLPDGEPDASASFEEKWRAFRALVNTREPFPADPAFLAVQDELLRGMIADAGITPVDEIAPASADHRLSVWQGDITTLAADAIVNAANSGMTGCWQPLHSCIDNAIHTFAGVQLRLECARLMEAQGHPEPTAQAKVTGAYNLPARRVIHTVGPIAAGRPTGQHRRELAQCYRSCLDAAAAEGLHTVAFCCISTGVFGFPQHEAAQIAVKTVRAWLDAHPGADMRVVFNTFLDADRAIYQQLLG